ncbi:MAG: Rne/Rng family ribonuclease, partial [Pseudomonadales bacterium]|nr:Rne/Rng family ribonuclease [Pseudomonadales bacterium]
MAEELLISVTNNETRVGIVTKGLLQEVFLERSGCRSTVGNIYKGKVVRTLPGMQSAFVDIGQTRAAFMHVTDLIYGHEIFEHHPESETPAITDLLHDGQDILVQVTKEPIN